MKLTTTAVLALAVLAPLPAHAYVLSDQEKAWQLQREIEGEWSPPGGSGDGYVAPSKDVPLYVPLTDEQQELPMISPGEVYDYTPEIEKPATPPAAKEITDRLPE